MPDDYPAAGFVHKESPLISARVCIVAACLVGVSASLTGCLPSGQPCNGDTETWSSEHFHYVHCRSDTTVCPGILDELERHLAVVSDYLGIRLEPGQRVTYRKYLDAHDFAENALCGDPDWGACAMPADVQASEGFYEHELIHAYVMMTWGGSNSMLDEGIAAALSCDPYYFGGYSDWRDVVLHGDTAHFSPGDDIATAKFLTYLLRTYGNEKTRELFRSIVPGTTPEEFAQIVLRIFGRSMDELWRPAWLDSPLCVPVWACSKPPEPEPAFSVGPTCSESGERVVDLTSEYGFVAQVTDYAIRALSCDESHPIPTGWHKELLLGGSIFWDMLNSSEPTVNWVQRTGRTALTHYDVNGTFTTSHVTISTLTSPWATDECGAGDLVPLAPDVRTILWVQNRRPSPGPHPKFMRVKPATPADFRVYHGGPFYPRLQVCAGCDRDCTEVGFDPVRMHIDSERILVLEAANGYEYWPLVFDPVTP